MPNDLQERASWWQILGTTLAGAFFIGLGVWMVKLALQDIAKHPSDAHTVGLFGVLFTTAGLAFLMVAGLMALSRSGPQ